MLRIFLFFMILVLLPIIIIVGGFFVLIIYILVKLGIIQSSFLSNNKFKTAMSDKKSFTEKTLRQVSCKHQNLEQKNDILLCSDCGKIIQNR